MVRIGGASLNQIPLDWNNNTGNIIAAINAARRDNVRILCLPELCITGYGCEDWFLSDWVAARALEAVETIRLACVDITVSVGLPVTVDNVTYNGACVIRDQRVLGITCKQFLARDGVHYEPRWFNPWPQGRVTDFRVGEATVPLGDVVYEAEGVRFGFEICEDAWHKTQRPGYRLKERGVQLILNPSASHFAMGKSLTREAELVVEGSEKFGCAYVFANLLGNEAGRMIYDGDIIIGQRGRLLAVNRRLSFRPFTLLAASVDLRDPSRSETVPSQDNKDRNEELTQAVSLALFDYLRKSRSRSFVLSLSGGADSSSCAVFVAEMVRRATAELGWPGFVERLGWTPEEAPADATSAMRSLLVCAYQGTRNSSTDTLDSARSLATSLGATFHHWHIDDEVRSYSAKIEKAIGRPLSWDRDDITLQNIQARSRSPIIWMLANIHRAVLLTTSNRSEGDVGYATMDGDTSGSLAPIAGLSKPFILQWLRWAEEHLGYQGLAAVNKLQPTAELRPLERAQTDESDLMPYPLLAAIEHHAIYLKRSPLRVFEALRATYPDEDRLRNYIRKFFRLWAANQWKRERLAPAFHLDDLNVDPRTWCRFPILSSAFAEELRVLDAG